MTKDQEAVDWEGVYWQIYTIINRWKGFKPTRENRYKAVKEVWDYLHRYYCELEVGT